MVCHWHWEVGVEAQVVGAMLAKKKVHHPRRDKCRHCFISVVHETSNAYELVYHFRLLRGRGFGCTVSVLPSPMTVDTDVCLESMAQ